MKKNIVVFAGTRPEIIKLAPVIKLLKEEKRVNSYFVLTGQHKELIKPFLKDFDLVPDHELNSMWKGQGLNQLLSKILLEVEHVFDFHYKPDLVVVQGDTTSALGVAIAAFHRRIPIAHVEAGLRTWDYKEPFPEEMNRVVIDDIADLLFAPTPNAEKALGLKSGRILLTGNTVVDALKMIQDSIQPLYFKEQRIIWTMHRREGVKDYKQMLQALKVLAKENPEFDWVIPIHPNPAVVSAFKNAKLDKLKNVRIVEPMGYKEFINSARRAKLVITDSGGIQEEAPTIRTPAIVIRNCTERREAEHCGWTKVVGRSKVEICNAFEEFKKNHGLIYTVAACWKQMHFFGKQVSERSPFGDGMASNRCVAAMLNFLGVSKQEPEEWKPYE